jgi:hypothetical protein
LDRGQPRAAAQARRNGLDGTASRASAAARLGGIERCWRLSTVPNSRTPVWSLPLTRPVAARIPTTWRPAAVWLIKAIHSLVFFSIAGAILVVAWDGLRQRPRRRDGIAAGLALAETAVFASNNLVCPLTPLAEELGAASGSVTDIFLPDAISRRIPVISGTTLVVGLLLHLRAARRIRQVDLPLTTRASWPARRDSNPRPTDPKSVALIH